MYTVAEIQSILQPSSGKDIHDPGRQIRYLSIDSRTMVFPAESLFFALGGTRKDGHAYIGDAYELGCRAFVVCQEGLENAYPEASFLVVADVVAALQAIALHHRQRFDLPVIALTGSNGKTWVKEWLFAICQDHFSVVRSPGSFNSQIGVPLSLWQIEEAHTLALIEAGISRRGEMKGLASLISPDMGIFTWIGDAHQEGFSSREEKIREKLDLFEGVSTIFYCADQQEVAPAIETRFAGRELVTWSMDGNADLVCSGVRVEGGSAFLTCRYRGQEADYMIPFSDEISVQNSLHCALAAHYLGIPKEVIKRRMTALQPMHMRMEIVEALHNCILINDAYSLDMASLGLALRKLDVVDRKRRKTIIISDLPVQDGEAYQRMGRLIDSYRPYRVLGIGQEIGRIGQDLSQGVEFSVYSDTAAFREALPGISFDDEIILLKGARRFRFEHIAQYLTEKNHTVSLHIDFNAMLHNLQYFSRHIPPGVKVMAVIKASAYGSGSSEIARFLEFFRLDYLAVALIDEGIELRKAGIAMPILVLNPDSNELDDLFTYALEPEVYSFRILKQIGQKARQRNQLIRVHLKINTGMNRLGFDMDEVPALIAALADHAGHIEVASVFSHLSSSDMPDEDGFTFGQVEQFERAYDALASTLPVRPVRHLLNSSGILRFPESAYEMVRIGIGLYGVGMGPHNKHLVPVHALRTRVVQVRAIDAGASVGYSRAFRTGRPMRLATLNLGYADGLPRNISNGKYSFTIRGKEAPVVGNVCMDLVMCDVTHIPDAAEGDEAWVFHQGKSCELLAEAAGTIPYEVLARIAPRVKRIFHYS